MGCRFFNPKSSNVLNDIEIDGISEEKHDFAECSMGECSNVNVNVARKLRCVRQFHEIEKIGK